MVLPQRMAAHHRAGLVVGTSYSGRIGQSWWLWAFDSHKDTLAGCGIDGVGRAIEYRSFANTASGHRRALEWVRQLDAGRVAIEGSGGYGRPLALVLAGAGVEVVEVPPQDGC